MAGTIGPIEFITSNPATDAFNVAEKNRRESDLSDLKLATGKQELSEKQLTQPTRLRRLEADTSTAETGAQTAKDVAPYAAPEAAARLRQTNAGAQNAELQGFYKSLEAANKGDTEGAKAISEAIGHPLPDAVINDAETRQAVTEAAKQAQQRYPNRPRDQATYIQRYLEGRAAGTLPTDATAPYSVQGAPEPQETASTFANRFEPLAKTRINPDTGKEEPGYAPFDRTSGLEGTFVPGQVTGKNGGAGGRKITGTEAIIDHLRAENPNLSYSDALSIAKRSGQSADVLVLRREGLALSAAKADTNYLTNPGATIEKYRSQYGLPPPGSGPQASPGVVGPNETITGVTSTPAPVTPAPPGSMSPGDGGKPLNIPLPPNPPGVPPGSAYSPSRRMWRSSDGQVFDENGIPIVTQ